MDFRRMTREFLLGETKAPSVASYIQSISEVLEALRPRTRADTLRIETARGALKEVRRHTRRLQERVNVLEEQVQVLEESKEG
jgi:ABC-type phosphate transport system auxiliary subunit